MIPIRDTIRSETYPIVNSLIIAVNVLVFLVELSQGQRLNKFVYIYGLVPARYAVPQISAYFTSGQQVISFLTFMFLHGGFLHLLGNMWSLYIFGDNVEDRLGHFRYLAYHWRQRGHCRGHGGLLCPLSQSKGSDPGAYLFLFLFFRATRIPFSGYMVYFSVPERRRDIGSGWGHRLVGPYRGVCIRHHLFETLSDTPRIRREKKNAGSDKKTNDPAFAGDSSCRVWKRPGSPWPHFRCRARGPLWSTQTG